MSRTALAIATLLLLGACATGGERAISGTNTEEICTQERELGSYIPIRRCRTAKQLEREQREAEEALNIPTVVEDSVAP